MLDDTLAEIGLGKYVIIIILILMEDEEKRQYFPSYGLRPSYSELFDQLLLYQIVKIIIKYYYTHRGTKVVK